MGLILKSFILVLASMAPLLGASAAQTAAFCKGLAETENLRDRITCVSQLVATKSEEIMRRMGVASQRTTLTSPLSFTNEEFNTLFDSQRMREGISAPQLRFDTEAEPSVCGEQLVHDLPIYYCVDDGKIVINVSPGFLDRTNPYGQAVAAGRLSTACMIAHEVGHHLIENMAINQAFVNRGSEPEAIQELHSRGEFFSDFFAGAFMSIAREMPEFREELGSIPNLNACNEMIRLTGTDAPGINNADSDHGSARQRLYWFNRGVGSSGNIRLGDVFYPHFQDILNAVTIN